MSGGKTSEGRASEQVMSMDRSSRVPLAGDDGRMSPVAIPIGEGRVQLPPLPCAGVSPPAAGDMSRAEGHGRGVGLRLCISDKLPGDAAAAFLRATFLVAKA